MFGVNTFGGAYFGEANAAADNIMMMASDATPGIIDAQGSLDGPVNENAEFDSTESASGNANSNRVTASGS